MSVEKGQPPADADPMGTSARPAAVRSGPAAPAPPPSSDPLLPPTEALSDEAFEDFTERLLNAHKFADGSILRATRVTRWGRRGDKQDGIDFAGDLSDDRTASWQCKRYRKFTPRQAREAVKAVTYPADVHHLVLSCEASQPVRLEIAKHRNWVLLDKRGLGQRLEDLPRHKRRDVLDATWGPQVRKQLVQSPGQDAFVSIQTFAADRTNPDTLLNDLGPLAGRATELAALTAATDRSSTWPSVVLVTGPGGRGKTRLLLEALQHAQERDPQIPVLVLAPGMPLDVAAIADLPGSPALVIIDDAHQEPDALEKVLAYARQTAGTQVVMAARPSALAAVRAQIVDRLAPDQLCTIDIGELTRRDARELINGLAVGLDLDFGLKEYLAGQAMHSPHVAVLTVGLIRRGELTGALAVAPDLRERVLQRYRDVSTGEVAGVNADTVRRVLAVYAALGSVADTDDQVHVLVAEASGLTRPQLARLATALRDRGVLVSRDGHTRVVPDVLGDDALEQEAAAGALDTGFTRELWSTFGRSQGIRLVLSLADLDWRLTHQGGPSVIDLVWQDLSHQLLTADLDNLHAVLRSIGRLASTQPGPFLAVLETLRDRLTPTAAIHHPSRAASTPFNAGGDEPDTEELDAASDTLSSIPARRTLFGLAPVQPMEVLQQLAPLYARCAVAEPALLEPVIDALWQLRRDDHRPTNPHHDHPEQVLGDVLADIGDLPDTSFPVRIVARVKQWLETPERDEDAATPLFALRKLLAKQGVQFRQTDPRTVQYGAYSISAAWARPVRDRVRDVLQAPASGDDLRRAGDAVDLLGELLRQAHGLAGDTVTDSQILAWEDDDLATLAVLAAASRTTRSGVVRRRIRHEISWSAEHAHSIPVRHTALTLLTDLDNREGDDLAELVLNEHHGRRANRRGIPVPNIEELRVAVATERARQTVLSTAQRKAERDAQAHESVERRMAAHDTLLVNVTTTLVALGSPEAIVAALNGCSREVVTVAPDRGPSLWTLYRQIGAAMPVLMPELVRGVSALPSGPLDKELHLLLNAWVAHDEQSLLGWLADLTEHRPAVRVAVAQAFANHGWADRGSAFTALFEVGCTDADPDVRDAFWQSSHFLLVADPGRGARRLLDAQATPFACERALQQACAYDGDTWGAGLTADDAAVVLQLIDRAEWQDWTLQHIATGIATNRPLIVLEHFAGHDRLSTLIIGDVDGLAAALEAHGDVLARWLVQRAASPKLSTTNSLVGLVLADGLGPKTAQALEPLVVPGFRSW